MFTVEINLDDLHRMCSENCDEPDSFDFEKTLNEKEEKKIADLIEGYEILFEDQLMLRIPCIDLVHELKHEYSRFFKKNT